MYRPAFKAPKNDRFQVISEHSQDTLLIDPSYLGIERSANALIYQASMRFRDLPFKRQLERLRRGRRHFSTGFEA
jgi:hypothetical protein